MDWHNWSGGECPVDPEANVEIKLRCGEYNRGRARLFYWRDAIGPFGYEGDDDIIAYRMLEAA